MWTSRADRPIYFGCILQLLGLFFFSKGFFPQKKAVLSGYALPERLDAPKVFDRLVFVVIDALRTDFAFGPTSNMAHMHRLINEGALIPYTGKASTPTVTLPRLKCLTTGSITGFLDAVLNIAESDSSATVAEQDSWVKQMSIAGRSIHMYGDDTWERLFPNLFAQFEGTSSFFVRDFTEVDNNVTRHLGRELTAGSWDTLILHYLGLDHIGHLEGPLSQHMPGKQAEMDTILFDIYSQTTSYDSEHGSKTLTIFLGDHGMTGDGNHGGSSDTETHTAMAFLSASFANDDSQSAVQWPDVKVDNSTGFLDLYSKVIQSDVVPALSLLLGLPIPRNSLGVIPPRLLHIWRSSHDRMRALTQNARQLQALFKAGKVVTELEPWELPCRQLSAPGLCRLEDIDLQQVIDEGVPIEDETLYRMMHQMQRSLMLASSDYNMRAMHIGISLLLISILFVFWFRPLYHMPFISTSIMILVPLCHSMTAFASSFVEEEHVFWYYATSAILAFMVCLQTVQNYRYTSGLVSLIAFRLLRRFNQTGQKFAGASDIASILTGMIYYEELFLFLILFLCTYSILRDRSLKGLSKIALLLCNVSILAFRSAASSSTIFAARCAWITLILSMLTGRWSTASGKKESDHASTLLFLLQSKPQNFPVLLFFGAINNFLREQENLPITIVAFTVLQQASFYALGNSNSLSGLDLSQAYNGVSTYNEYAVGFLLFVSSFLGPIYWHLALRTWTRRHKDSIGARDLARWYLAMCSCMYATALSISCYTLRHHLFVFSVFSPKLLFAAAWSVFYALAVFVI